MKRLLISICMLLLAGSSQAQGLREFVFIGPAPNNAAATQTSFGILPAPPPPSTGLSSAYTAGLGLEQRFNKYWGAGLDLAGIVPGSGKVAANTVAAFSPNGYFYLPRSEWQGAKVEVYATAGYSLLFRDFAANGLNVGGGTNYWFQERLGLMLEFRFLKAFGANLPTPASQYYLVRIGLKFR